ncbi:MAG: hypothetical protein HY720_02265 [Planctomycetes bacterium]|nr:hypothetical protein [Planctomycetota bacterium]
MRPNLAFASGLDSRGFRKWRAKQGQPRTAAAFATYLVVERGLDPALAAVEALEVEAREIAEEEENDNRNP